jgi:hypothetical protein
MRFLDQTQRRTTVGRTPLDEWLARRRDLYLTSHSTHDRFICPRWETKPQSQQPGGRRPTPCVLMIWIQNSNHTSISDQDPFVLNSLRSISSVSSMKAAFNQTDDPKLSTWHSGRPESTLAPLLEPHISQINTYVCSGMLNQTLSSYAEYPYLFYTSWRWDMSKQ